MQNNKVFLKIGTQPQGKVQKAGSGKKLNEKFLDCYMEIDRLCCMKFGIAMGGITEYINKLNSTRFTPGRDDAVSRLIRYRDTRNRFAHEPRAIRRAGEISKNDIKWLKGFKRELAHRRDPISVYLRCESRYARRKKLRRVVYASMLGVIATLALILCFVLQNK